MKECHFAGKNRYQCSLQANDYCYLRDLFFKIEPIPKTLDKDSKIGRNRVRLEIMFRDADGCEQIEPVIHELMEEREEFDRIER